MASEADVKAAIRSVKNNPKTASKVEYELVERAAKQAGSIGNDARSALQGR